MKKVVLTTDSRRRPDRQWLEKGDCDNSTQWKRVAEYRQRIDENDRKENAKKAKGDKKVETKEKKNKIIRKEKKKEWKKRTRNEKKKKKNRK